MKKILKVGMLVACVLFLTACGRNEAAEIPTITSKPKLTIIDPATPTPTLTLEQGDLPEAQELTPTPEPTSEPTSTPKPTATPKPTPKSTPKPTATPVPTKAEKLSYKKGTLTENSFKSEWMGLKFAVPKGVIMSSQEELDETMRLIEEATTGKEIEGALNYEELSLVYEMNLVWQDNGLILQMLVERVPESATIDDYLEGMEEELRLIEESGLTYIVDDQLYSEEIGGKKFSNFGYTVYYEEVGMRQENYLRKQDDRIIVISIMCQEGTEDSIPELLDCFTAY